MRRLRKSSVVTRKINTSISFSLVLLFIMVLIPTVNSHSVEPVWESLTYSQGDIAQFKVYGDKNQSNISVKIQYYYNPDPLNESMNETLMATKWFSGIRLDRNGTGLFEVKLIKENGFEYPGQYNVIFIFGNDVQNESGFETYTAPRKILKVKLDYNPMYLIELNEQNNRDAKTNVDKATALSNSNWNGMAWYTIIITLVFFWGLFVVGWHSKYDETITSVFLDKLKSLYKKMSHPLGHLYPLINSDNFVELRRTGLRVLVKQEKWLSDKYNFHKAKANHFENRLKKTIDDKGMVEGELLKRDPGDPHVWVIRQRSDSTIELREGEISIVPGKLKKKVKKGGVKADS